MERILSLLFLTSLFITLQAQEPENTEDLSKKPEVVTLEKDTLQAEEAEKPEETEDLSKKPEVTPEKDTLLAEVCRGTS